MISRKQKLKVLLEKLTKWMSSEFVPINVSPADLTMTLSKDFVAIEQGQLEEQTLGNNTKKIWLISFREQKGGSKKSRN